MAEPLHTMWRKGCVIILAVLRSISSGLSSKNSSSIIILFKKVTPYCYSCHWKREELDRVQLEIAKSVNLRKDSHAATIIIEQPPSRPHQRPQQQTKVIDVYGRETEPICSYRKCHHKFSVHGHDNHNCKCRHAMNYATGISILPLTKIEVL
jgi:hypothetical protein